MVKAVLRILSVMLIIAGLTQPAAAAVCEDAQIIDESLITDVCWDCLFPLKIAGVTLQTGERENPPEASSSSVCSCSPNGIPEPGLVMSMWEPTRLIEFPRQAGCSSVLGGVSLGFDKLNVGGQPDDTKTGKSYYHYHYYSFPLFMIMQLFSSSSCHDGWIDLDLMYFSEIDPAWNNSSFAFFTTPESAMVANPIASAACPADAAAATAGYPLNSLFWCAGSWGSIYPLSGIQNGAGGVLRDTSLLSTRLIASLHRKGFARQTMGEAAQCEPIINPMLPKTQYKMSMMYPRAETERAHVIGESTVRWGLGRTIPGVASTPVYLLWRLNDCCNTL
ncbi:TraU family protein [Hydrocarboniclastica marina]|uniref:Conjugal transfer protein TraU n=1 Tax=Hydrocarboniclastica marina TaxID=2259620 RepID=A0A4P7XMA3_9ALTE|nr:TraU family protein [Hydrocarboniclastica marina]QCF28145.1 conjugal transfer protein TraU [Hydrocarboniclastica marina]